MQHADIQYGPGTAPALHPSHYNAVDVAHPAVPSTSSTTSVLRSWRKKDAIEKVPPSEPTPSTPAAENQGPVARVAPHTHYHKPSSNYNYQSTYSDYSMQTPPIQQAAPVKYSEIIEPLQGMDHLSTALPKPKEKTYVDMCNIQAPQAKPYQEPNYKYNNVQFKDQYPQFLQQKDHHMTGYVQKESGNFPQYMSPNYKMPGQYSRNFQRENNDFLTSLKQIAPHMAQDILNDTHLHDAYSVYPSMEQNRMYQQQRMYQRTPPMHSNPNYQQRPMPHNYNQYINQQRMSNNGYRMYPQQNLRYPQIPNDIPPRHQFHDVPVNYGPMPSRISPNYPPCNQMEYSQHYQHRQVPLRQEFMPMPNKSFIETHPEIPEIVPEESLHQPNKSLKRFLETWSEDHTVEESDEPDKHPRQLAQNKENTLYVFDAMDIPSENIPQFLHLQSVDKLPANIRGFYTEGLPQNKNGNCSMQEANKGNVEARHNEAAHAFCRTDEVATKSGECLQMEKPDQLHLRVDGASTQRRKEDVPDLDPGDGARKHFVENPPRDFERNLSCSKRKENLESRHNASQNDKVKQSNVNIISSVILQNTFANQLTSNKHDECLGRTVVKNNSNFRSRAEETSQQSYVTSHCVKDTRDHVEGRSGENYVEGGKTDLQTNVSAESNFNQCIVGNYPSAKQHEITKHNVSDILNDNHRRLVENASDLSEENAVASSEAELRYSVISKWKPTIANDPDDNQAEVKHLKSSQENRRDYVGDSSKSDDSSSERSETEPNSINDEKLNRRDVSANETDESDSYDESPINLSSSQNIDDVVEKGNFSSIFNIEKVEDLKKQPIFARNSEHEFEDTSSEKTCESSGDSASESQGDDEITQDGTKTGDGNVREDLDTNQNKSEVALELNAQKSKESLESDRAENDAPKHVDENVEINEESSNVVSNEGINIDDKLYKKLTHKEVDKLTDDLQGLIDAKVHNFDENSHVFTGENDKGKSNDSGEAEGANWYLLRIANELIQINITEEDGKKVISVTPITKVKVVTNVDHASAEKTQIADDNPVCVDEIKELASIENNETVINFEDVIDGGILEPETVDGGILEPETVDGGILESETVDGGMLEPETVDGGILESETVSGGILEPETVDERIEFDTSLRLGIDTLAETSNNECRKETSTGELESDKVTEIAKNTNGLSREEIVSHVDVQEDDVTSEIWTQTNRAKNSSKLHRKFLKNKRMKLKRQAIRRNKSLLRRTKQTVSNRSVKVSKKIKFNFGAPVMRKGSKTNVDKSILKESEELPRRENEMTDETSQPRRSQIDSFLDESQRRVELDKPIPFDNSEEAIDFVEDAHEKNARISTEICDDQAIEPERDVIKDKSELNTTRIVKIDVREQSEDHRNIQHEISSTTGVKSNRILSTTLDDNLNLITLEDKFNSREHGLKDAKHEVETKEPVRSTMNTEARISETKSRKSSKISFEIRRNPAKQQRKISLGKLKESFKDALQSNRSHKELDVKINHANKMESNVDVIGNVKESKEVTQIDLIMNDEVAKLSDGTKNFSRNHPTKHENLNLIDAMRLQEPQAVAKNDVFRNLSFEETVCDTDSNRRTSKVERKLVENVTKAKDSNDISYKLSLEEKFDSNEDEVVKHEIADDAKQTIDDVTFKETEIKAIDEERCVDESKTKEICPTNLNDALYEVEKPDGCDITEIAKEASPEDFSIKKFVDVSKQRDFDMNAKSSASTDENVPFEDRLDITKGHENTFDSDDRTSRVERKSEEREIVANNSNEIVPDVVDLSPIVESENKNEEVEMNEKNSKNTICEVNFRDRNISLEDRVESIVFQVRDIVSESEKSSMGPNETACDDLVNEMNVSINRTGTSYEKKNLIIRNEREKSPCDVTPKSFEIPSEISFKDINYERGNVNDSSTKIENDGGEIETVNNNLDESATCKLDDCGVSRKKATKRPCRDNKFDSKDVTTNVETKAKKKKVSFAKFAVEIPNRLREEFADTCRRSELDFESSTTKEANKFEHNHAIVSTTVKSVDKQNRNLIGRDESKVVERQSIERRIENMFSQNQSKFETPSTCVTTNYHQNTAPTPVDDLLGSLPNETNNNAKGDRRNRVDYLDQTGTKIKNNFAPSKNFAVSSDVSGPIDVRRYDKFERTNNLIEAQKKKSLALNSKDTRTNRRRLSLQEYHNRKKVFGAENVAKESIRNDELIKNVNRIIPNYAPLEIIKDDLIAPLHEKSKDSIRSVIEEKVNSLESFLPKVNKSPIKGTKKDVLRKLDELLVTNPINFEHRTSEYVLIKRFFNHEALNPDEIKKVRQIVQSKRALEEIKARTKPDVKRRKSCDFGAKSVNIDFNDFDIQSHFPKFSKAATCDELITKREQTGPVEQIKHGTDLNQNYSVFMDVQPNCTLGDLDDLQSKVGDFLQSSKDLKNNRSELKVSAKIDHLSNLTSKNGMTIWSNMSEKVAQSPEAIALKPRCDSASNDDKFEEATNRRNDSQFDLSAKASKRSTTVLNVSQNRFDGINNNRVDELNRSNELTEKDLRNKVDDFLQSLKGVTNNRSRSSPSVNLTLKRVNETIGRSGEAQIHLGRNSQNKANDNTPSTYRNNRVLTAKDFATNSKAVASPDAAKNELVDVLQLPKRRQESKKAIVVEDDRTQVVKNENTLRNQLSDAPQGNEVKNRRGEPTPRSNSVSTSMTVDDQSSIVQPIRDERNFSQSNETTNRRRIEFTSKNSDLAAVDRLLLQTNFRESDDRSSTFQDQLAENKSLTIRGDFPQSKGASKFNSDLTLKNVDSVVDLRVKDKSDAGERSCVVQNHLVDNTLQTKPQSKCTNNRRVESKRSDSARKNVDLIVDLCARDKDKTRSELVEDKMQVTPQSKCVINHRVESKSRSDFTSKVTHKTNIEERTSVVELVEKSSNKYDSPQINAINNHVIKAKSICVAKAKTGHKFSSDQLSPNVKDSPKPSTTSHSATNKAVTSPVTKASVKSFQETVIEANDGVEPPAPTKLNTKAALKSFQDLPQSIVTNSPNLKSKLNTFLDICRKTIENAGPNQEDKVKEIKDIVNKMSPNLTPKLKSPDKIGHVEGIVSSNEHETQEAKSNLKLLLKIPSEKKRKRKRFRNLYTAEDSDEEPPVKVCDVSGDKLSDDVPDYSVYQRKTQAGVPKLIITRRKSGFRQNLEPRVRITRLESIELMVKRRRRTIRLARR